ncbi:MFS transporter [Pseudolysinimonas sp.]|jgi:DHA1 family inner membrane transport protein|uniref:MFS transporter n=1 Tax=Pseudolysinimonas sp. TaxID=2680009 RepID=UPI0037833797
MSATSGERFPLFRLLVLAGAIFVSVSSEFLPTGLLPDIAADLDVSESRVGLLVTLFALTVVVSTAPLTLLTRRLSRKWVIVAMLGVFALSNVLAAFAPTYEVLAVARVIGGLAHGLFWAVTTPYTALLVPGRQLARAVAVTTAGGSFAFILGVPLTAAIGHALDWRAAFGVMAGLVVVFTVLAAVLLPAKEHRRPQPEAGAEPVRDKSWAALGIVAVTVLLVAIGHNTFYTYIAPWAIAVGGIPDDLVSLALLIFGVAGALGLLVSAVYGDRFPRLTVNVMTTAVIATIVLTAVAGRGVVVAILLLALWSMAFGGLPSLFHTRSLHATSGRIRDLAGAAITTAFNAAIGGGALIGGIVFDELGVAAVPWVAALIVAVGFAWVLLTDPLRIRSHPAEAHKG